MSVSAAGEGSEDVNVFLQRIKELGDRRDQEDNERNKKLEEEILQGRKERQARRAERARSISPTKSSPANTPTASRISTVQVDVLSNSPSTNIVPQESQPTGVNDALEKLTGVSTSPTKENSTPFDNERALDDPDTARKASLKSSPSSAMPSRNSPLSWQRRPNSQSSDRPKSRPLSMVAAENAARSPKVSSTPEPSTASATEPTISREQIAQSLALKDPAWFRQTADRGLNSPAYRRNQVEDENRSDHGSNQSRVQMPGMSREGSESRESTEEPERTSSPSRSSVSYGSGSRASYQPTTKLSSGLGSPVPLTSAQKFDPPTDPKSENRGLAMSPSQGRISPDRLDRPVSPTKGMGGFVQSAMMKRSDSVNKRWNVQAPPGLSRGNSGASNRASPDIQGTIANPTMRESRPSSLSRENSPHPNSRPTSSHSNVTITQEQPATASSTRSSMTTSTTNDGFVKPPLPTPRTQTPLGVRSGDEEGPFARGETTPPVSPSKTMDPKRWSPTKSSWLESALNKPESPKPKATPPPQQPAWMVEINKAKQKASVDLTRNPPIGPKHEVNIGGLMRSPPLGGPAKPISIGGLPAGFSSGPITKNRPEVTKSQDSKESSKQSSMETKPPTASLSSKPSPPRGKEKPETPPKNFRANLKPRQVTSDNGDSNEPEFKNVFGQLRRTKTQNYVAPDELKDNITRGKAALNITGGPKKTERKDEFKEAILKKKEDFKKTQLEGKGVTRSTGSANDTSVPEALAKRQELGRSGSVTNEPESSMSSSSTSALKNKIQEPLTSKPTFKDDATPTRLQTKDSGVGGKLAGRLNPGLAGLLARGPPSMANETSRSSSPALSQRTLSIGTSTTNIETPEPGPQLSHMTKGRARGPRRKAPSTVPTGTAPDRISDLETKAPTATTGEGLSTTSGVEKQAISVSKESTLENSTREIENTVSQPSSPRKLDMKRRSQFLQEIPTKTDKSEPNLDAAKPLSPKKTTNTFERPAKPQESSSAVTPVVPITKAKPATPVKSPSLTSKSAEKSSVVSPTESRYISKSIPSSLSPTKTTLAEQATTQSTASTQDSPFHQRTKSGHQDSAISVKNATALWDRTPSMKPMDSPPRVKSPIRLPTLDDEKASMINAGLRAASPTKEKGSIGLGIQSTRESNTSRRLPTPPMKGPLSPPPSAGFQLSASPTKSNYSPVPQTSEASTLLTDFFGEKKPMIDFKGDTAAILATRSDQGENIKTLRSSLYQLSSDGKKQLVPSHQERILFEGNMYVCTHTFGNAAGKKMTEVYFWRGDEVPNSTADESKIFAQREAKTAGGKLVVIRQGKETPEFFHALGGIIIVRRGSSNKFDSLAPHILCGRKHFGQIAFDEVDYSPKSLCSGFPYLISAQSGKSYLWKGRGSGIDELSCARLIGMDFGLTGEIEEVEDGNEPVSFLQIFGNDAQIPKSADHWRMKPNYTKYCGRLFIADSTAKEQIKEINPFCQADLVTREIYVLDAFFEIYILVGSKAQSQYAALQIALMFAQEYGILAAGMEDRPFVPVTNVVMGGIPKDMKAVFRKWSDAFAPTDMTTLGSSSLRRGRSLRVVPLTAAIEATRK